MSNSAKKTTDDDEVEQLLRAAQDDVLLKLNVNSHMARASASAAIDPDLDRRFEALRKPQKPAKVDDTVNSVPKKLDTSDNKVDGAAAEDDLFARFAALKNSLPSNNRNESKSKSNFAGDVSANQQGSDEESEDEVEKVIRWATDAARLDPSPPSDNDDDGDNDDEDDDSDEDDGVNSGKKGKRK